MPYETDEVTRIIQDDINEPIYSEIKRMTVSELREWILDEETTGEMIRRVSRGLTSEMVAAVAKIMSNLDLVYGARKIRVTAHCNTTIGEEGTLSSRLQPNHPTDDPDGIMASLLEGLTYGAGDALLGLNPVDDSAESVARVLHRFEEVKQKHQIPTPDLCSGTCDNPDGGYQKRRSGRSYLPVYCRIGDGEYSVLASMRQPLRRPAILH